MKVTLTRWRDARTDPPPYDPNGYLVPVLMEVDGEAVPGWWNNRDWLDWECTADSPDMPERWAAMPVPPDEDGLTDEDVRALYAPALFTNGRVQIARDRLRRALNKETP